MLRGGWARQKCAMSRFWPFLGLFSAPGDVFVEDRAPAPWPPARLPRQAIRMYTGPQLMQSTHVDAAFEVNHLVHGTPERHPADAVKFGFVAAIEAHTVVVGHEPQHEPALFLANTQRFAMPAHELVGQSVS